LVDPVIKLGAESTLVVQVEAPLELNATAGQVVFKLERAADV
jgi:hypothetical protein